MSKKKIFSKYRIIFTILLSIIYVVSLTGCDGGDVPCKGPRYDAGSPDKKGACISECNAPAECDRTHPGGKGPDCEVGQTCNTNCYCEWVDKDLDGHTTSACDKEAKNVWVTLLETSDSGEKTIASIAETTKLRVTQISNGLAKLYSMSIYTQEGLYRTSNYQSEIEVCDIVVDEEVCHFETVYYAQIMEGSLITEKFDPKITITQVILEMDQDASSKVGIDVFTKQKELCDCDDNNPYMHPDKEEICDYRDNNCNGVADEGEVCKKHIYICKTDEFETQSQGDGDSLSYGYCQDETWCHEEIDGETGSCDYDTENDDVGSNDFFAYACDNYDCFKFTYGGFQVCGTGWDCSALCFPGDCNYDSKLWCNNAGTWQAEEWCHSECGRYDSECGGNCEPGECDTDVKMWCNDLGYWVDDNSYCDCDTCGTVDSTCSVCTCEDGRCDTTNEKFCEEGLWASDEYCLKCCREDHDCFEDGYCTSCNDGICDIDNNQYCSGNSWFTTNYCAHCEPYDFDCGAEACAPGNCDPVDRLYCDGGEWIDPGDSYCFPGYCGLQDSSCQCSTDPDACCSGEDDLICDPDCLEQSEYDCDDLCTVGPYSGQNTDCCYDAYGDGCDSDCIPGVDPDCQDTCNVISDDCCSGSGDEVCDPDCTENADSDCSNCTISSDDCCVADIDSVCDPDCIPSVDPDCAAKPCDENWFCEEWDQECDGVHSTHTCLQWTDTNDCNTFYDKPYDLQDCHKEFTCQPEDDQDEDGYPVRACYDAVNDIVMDDFDCDDGDASQNPAAEEVCNGEDDNCDDSIDEGCPCQGGDTQQCGRTEGLCRPGIQTCIDGYWGLCGGSGYIGPKSEECDDGIDNNCDSYIDENCACVEGEQQECGTDVGICKEGYQVCYNNTFGSFCNNESKPLTEICDNDIDDDCDAYIDGDDSTCQVTTPVTEASASCSNRKQDGDEEGVDCGGSCSDACNEKPPACDYGKIEEKCMCGKAKYTKGYCCNGKYSISGCTAEALDSDDDGCLDDDEFQLGTDPYSADTDGDGYMDCDDYETAPLCNDDEICDSEREYPETVENCADCSGSAVGLLMWLLLVIILLALVGIGGYLFMKSKGKNLSDFIKIKKNGKKEEKKYSKFSFTKGQPSAFGKPAIKPMTKQEKIATKKPISPLTQKPAQREPIKKKDMIHLRAFVHNSLRKGYTKLQIRKEAMKSGYTKEQIDQALKGKKSSYKLFK
ncbi:MAG: hypothetical protein KKA79_07420 [Nanoarchaeota archaeon]|nr:hypothetical protein [Nanoarchaeota archaeon]MCG2718576.1 hypothetical protein [Nanoarchaeota archaeon]